MTLIMPCSSSYLWLAENEGMQKKTETTKMGYLGTTIRIHSYTMVRFWGEDEGSWFKFLKRVIRMKGY